MLSLLPMESSSASSQKSWFPPVLAGTVNWFPPKLAATSFRMITSKCPLECSFIEELRITWSRICFVYFKFGGVVCPTPKIIGLLRITHTHQDPEPRILIVIQSIPNMKPTIVSVHSDWTVTGRYSVPSYLSYSLFSFLFFDVFSLLAGAY